jgi:phage terminase large subunit
MTTLRRVDELPDHLVRVVGVHDNAGVEYALVALQPKQYEAYQLTPLNAGPDGPHHIGYGGSAGGGKSFLARAVAVAVAFVWPGSTSIIFRQTEGAVIENHLNKFHVEIPKEFAGRPLWSYNGKEKCILWANGSRTYLGYLRQDSDVDRYQGPEYDVMIFEEATHYSWKQVSWLVSNRLRATVDGVWPFALYPSNPGSKGHGWFKRLFIRREYRGEERPEDYTFIQSRLKDNIELVRRDPKYARKLKQLPEPWRSWLEDGDWEAGAGMALSELRRDKHLIEPFPVPAHWRRFGAFDWGYRHPFSFGEYAVNEDGAVFKLDTVTGLRLQPWEIAERIARRVDVTRLDYVTAGHDAWAQMKARGENTPTIAEQFQKYGIYLTQANIDRVQGLNNLRAYLSWHATGPLDGNGMPTAGEPRLRFFDTPGNRKCLDQFEAMVTDPNDEEDVLKVNADEFGEGGDDTYDETRYAMASRPLEAPSIGLTERGVPAWAPATLKYEYEQKYRSKPIPKAPTPLSKLGIDSPFGEFL